MSWGFASLLSYCDVVVLFFLFKSLRIYLQEVKEKIMSHKNPFICSRVKGYFIGFPWSVKRERSNVKRLDVSYICMTVSH